MRDRCTFAIVASSSYSNELIFIETNIIDQELKMTQSSTERRYPPDGCTYSEANQIIFSYNLVELLLRVPNKT